MDDINFTSEELEALLGEQIKAERLRKNLTMATLAELAGVSESTVRSLEAGKGGRVGSLVRVARALGRADWLKAFRPAVKVSPLQIARGVSQRQRASRKATR